MSPVKRMVVGIDEVGRGALAGNVTVAAVAVEEEWSLKGVRDSKQLKPNRRAELTMDILDQVPHWVVARSNSKQIDEFGINTCILHLMGVCANKCLDRFPDALVIVDGDQFIPDVDPSVQRVIEKADQKFQSVGAASIIAKVHRDRYMIEAASRNMIYDWQRNSGYGTPVHIRMIKRHGIASEHRRSFQPIKGLIKKGVIEA